MIAIIKKICFLITGCVFFLSCKKYLDVKPDERLVTPSSVKDLQAILDNEQIFNNDYTPLGEIASDNYYLTAADWNSLAKLIADIYVWDPAVDFELSWGNMYQKVFYANVVLDHIDKVSNMQQLDRNAVKGSALFLRAFAFFKIAQVYALPYSGSTSSDLPGIPLILSSDINTVYDRSSLAQTYERILSDLKSASELLPKISMPLTRPNKAAAFALLSYICLITGDYEKGVFYSDASLAINSDLLDYNLIPSTTNPFQRFNKEVLFQARQLSVPILSPARAKIDSTLYNLYASNDLRKSLFFKSNNNGTYAFKGSYDANATAANLFCGITTDEVYLIRAECLARLGHTGDAMNWLNKLLHTRWKTNTYTDYSASTPEEALNIILEERRKELVFRGGTRWADIKRLASEPDRQIMLKRLIGSNQYLLPPGDLRYAFLIPSNVIQISGISQNKR